MALDPNKEVFMFVVEYEIEQTVVDDGLDDDENNEPQGSTSSEVGE